MIRIGEGQTLLLTPTPEHPRAPTLSLPFLSLHVCTCGALIKAYAVLDGKPPNLEAYGPDYGFRAGSVPGGFVLLRERHGRNSDPCVALLAVFGGPTGVARLVTAALGRAVQPPIAAPALRGIVDAKWVEALPGVRRIDDRLERRPPVYLVNADKTAREIVGPPDFNRYEEWQADAHAAVERLLTSVRFTAAATAIDIRTVERPPRRKKRASAQPPPEMAVVEVGDSAPPPTPQAPPPMPPTLALRPTPPPRRRRPGRAVQLSLFPT